MENITNEQINKVFGMIFQQYRLKNNYTQEKLAEELSKSTKTISQLETAKDGTSKMENRKKTYTPKYLRYRIQDWKYYYNH